MRLFVAQGLSTPHLAPIHFSTSMLFRTRKETLFTSLNLKTSGNDKNSSFTIPNCDRSYVLRWLLMLISLCGILLTWHTLFGITWHDLHYDFSRKKNSFTHDRCKMFLKEHCEVDNNGVCKIQVGFFCQSCTTIDSLLVWIVASMWMM